MTTIIRFNKISFLIGAHAAAFVWAFFAIKLASEGNLGPALTFGALAGLTILVLIAWWLRRLFPDSR
jgi:hypothetical protein